MFKILPFAAILTAFATGQYVDDDGTMQIGVGTLTRFGTFVHEGERYAVISTDKNAPVINADNVSDLPADVVVTEMFGAISFGKIGQFVIGMNETKDADAQKYFAEAVAIAYSAGDTYRAGSFSLLSIVDRNLVPNYYFGLDSMVKITDKLSGIEIVAMDETVVDCIGIKIDGTKTARLVQLSYDQLVGYLLEDQSIDYVNVDLTTIPLDSMLTQAPNGKLACIDRTERRLLLIDDAAQVIDMVNLPAGTLLAKVALTEVGQPQNGFLTVIMREDEHGITVETPPVNQFFEGEHAQTWIGLPQTPPETGVAPSK